MIWKCRWKWVGCKSDANFYRSLLSARSSPKILYAILNSSNYFAKQISEVKTVKNVLSLIIIVIESISRVSIQTKHQIQFHYLQWKHLRERCLFCFWNEKCLLFYWSYLRFKLLVKAAVFNIQLVTSQSFAKLNLSKQLPLVTRHLPR